MDDALEARLTELEIKISFNEDALDTINQALFAQQQLLDGVVRELRALRQQVQSIPSGERGTPEQEIPPHY